MLRRSDGHSLIEILVITGIIGVISGAALPHFDPRQQDVRTLMRELIGDFRMARTQALNTGVHYAVHVPSADTLTIQRMAQAADGSWRVDTVTRHISVPKHLSFWMLTDTVEFNTRGMMITAPQPLYVYLSDSHAGDVHSFSVWPSGQVHEEF